MATVSVRYIVNEVDAAIAFDGTVPAPGGWNRFSIEVDDLGGLVERLRAAGVRFRNEIVTGTGGKQILAEDPSGNPVELFEPTLPEAKLQ
jgi:catechol 2,3-dioxygenase-like lactoylglutathione lyase family enzyme